MIPHKEFKNIIDVVNRFPNEKTCHEYLASRRWSDGVMTCPHNGCKGETAYIFKDGIRYKCRACKRLYTAKTGTIMEASKIDTQKWFVAIYLFLHKKGISSIQLSKDISLTQKSAWFMLQRLRLVFGNEEQTQLDGTVEIDETFVGGKSRFKHKDKRLKHNPGRGWKDKTPVFGMLQRNGKFRAIVVNDVLTLTIKKTVLKNIKGGSTIYGDGFNGYRALHTFYDVANVDHGRGHYVDGDVHTNTIEGAWSQFKKGICATYHKTTRKHLQGYVNEFVFRYNYRNCDVQTQIERVVGNINCRLKYKDLIAA